MTKEQRKQRAIRKAIRTRQLNRAIQKRWDEVDGPATENFAALVNRLIADSPTPIRLRFTGAAGLTLRKGTGLGTLLRVDEQTAWSYYVKVDGYTAPRWYHRAFWEPLLP